jgi:C-terminal processing protease CtpA/Prc
VSISNTPHRLLLAVFVLAGVAVSQEMTKLERGQAQDMLQVVAGDVRKHYYDPNLHGVDWDATVAKARDEIGKATSMNMALSYIAAAMDRLNDSHTNFYPPERMHRFYYGWRYQMIGDRCYITQIRPGTDADAKGIHVGDEILTINGFLPDRNNFWKMQYVLETLRPQQAVKLLLQIPPNGKSREVEVSADVRLRKRATDLSYVPMREWEGEARQMRARIAEVGGVSILKIP